MRTTLLILLLLAAPVVAQNEGDTKKKAAKKPTPSERFWEARRVMLKGDPKSAAELFRTIVKESPSADVADDCLYWMGRCFLRIDDREPDAVVAFKRLIEELPESPFVDDAARELGRLGDKTIAPALKKRLEGKGAAAELAARALAELNVELGLKWLEENRGEKKKPVEKEADKKEEDPRAKEIRELREEVAHLRAELEECLKLIEELKAEKEAKKK